MALDELMTGYGGRAFPYPPIAGTYKGKNLVVCGDGFNVWQDLEDFGCRSNAPPKGRVDKDGWHFLTVNKLVETFPGSIEHCYSNQPHLLNQFVAARRQEYALEFGPPRHTHSIMEGAKHRWPWGGHGTSGLGAVLVGLGLGYDRIVLCGMPLDDGPHNGEPHWRKTTFASSEASGSKNGGKDSHWAKAIDLAFGGKVKSMSGRTREWLGPPAF